MKIALSVSPLQSGHKDRGTGSYTRSLIEALQQYQVEHVYSQFSKSRDIPTNTELVHYPFFDPFFVTLPVISRFPFVVTVHDVIPLVFPEHFPKGIRGSIKWEIQKSTLRKAKRIITDSHTSKNDIIKITQFDPDRIDVIPLAPQGVYATEIKNEAQDALAKKYELPTKYFLYVGDINWNKNVPNLILAWDMFLKSKDASSEYKLILVGKAFLNESISEVRALDSSIASLTDPTSVIRLGFVPTEDLVGLYKMAFATVIPSWYEGFGLTVLEAMSAGSLVLTTTLGSLGEIAGPALQVSGGNPDSIYQTMKIAIRLSQSERNKIIRAGHAWAKKFSWKKVASLTIASYEKAILGT